MGHFMQLLDNDQHELNPIVLAYLSEAAESFRSSLCLIVRGCRPTRYREVSKQQTRGKQIFSARLKNPFNFPKDSLDVRWGKHLEGWELVFDGKSNAIQIIRVKSHHKFEELMFQEMRERDDV